MNPFRVCCYEVCEARAVFLVSRAVISFLPLYEHLELCECHMNLITNAKSTEEVVLIEDPEIDYQAEYNTLYGKSCRDS